jgi:hypothetical protein
MSFLVFREARKSQGFRASKKRIRFAAGRADVGEKGQKRVLQTHF